MVIYDELINLAEKSQGSYNLSAEDLIAFVKAGAVRAYKAGDASRKDEDVTETLTPREKNKSRR